MSEIDLLPRADLPVIWDAFKAQAEPVRQIAETLTVTDISQKEEMALARKTRLTLREIRIAVEHKRVELGEGHLKEIQKVNGAAKAIREFIEPLEARLLVQESFAERAEEKRIALLAESRFLEVEAIKPRAVWVPAALAAMPQEEYTGLVARLRAEQAELQEANRLRAEAERRLAEQQIEMRRQEEEFLDKLQAEKVAENARLAVQRAEAKAEQDRQNAIAEAKALEVYADLKRKNEAEHAIRVIEALQQKRIRDEQAEKVAKLEAELAQERAAKQAEEKRVMELAIAPDVEKLWQFASLLRGIQVPGMVTPHGIVFAEGIYEDLKSIADDIEKTCKSWGLTGK